MLSHLMNKDLMLSFIKEHIPKFTQDEKLEIANLVMQDALADKRYIIIPYNESYKFVNMDTVLYYFQPNSKSTTADMHLLTGDIITCTASVHTWAQIENQFDEETKQRKFYNLDNGLLVNIKMVRYYDSYYRRVYFSDEHSIPVAPASTKQILPKVMGKQYDVYLQKDKNKMVEYAPTWSK